MNLDKQITIERRAHTQGEAGQVRETWREVEQVWASIRPLSGREYYASSGPRAEVTHEILMRFGADVLPKDRILYEGRVFEVMSNINVGERNRYLKITSHENADLPK